MLNLSRAHDFQVHLSPSLEYPAAVNPPSFNWPENIDGQQYNIELKNLTNGYSCDWQKVNSPMQLGFELPLGQYQWRLLTATGTEPEQVSEWVEFEITEALSNYIAPTAKELFEQCDGYDQWLMYFDEDIEAVKEQSDNIYPKLKHTASLSVPKSEITFPRHYQRGLEEGKRQAIAKSRLWIDRDLMTHALLYKVWEEEEHGLEAVERLLQFAEWSVEGPASILRPCTWGDEVGCSLARNLFLAYHWLSPLLKESEKAFFIRPMLVRIAQQMAERLEQDKFLQFPGHSHTSRLPAYLGIAALALYREHDREECEQWLTTALTIYRGILPFYGGIDGSWVEGPFYASTYSKWFHPFFLSVERLSGFSFYEHPFYQNFLTFARDFIAPSQDIHPFGDGFWCRRNGNEWPGFFSQNPLSIYASRFGDQFDYEQSLALESAITDFRLHLLDVIPTIKQIEFNKAAQAKKADQKKLTELKSLNNYYYHAGLGKLTQQQMALYYRASPFGNSSHRHGDQGNIGFFDKDVDILVPTGSYGYRFGSSHHQEWTRQTIAHNLPLVGWQGQTLDDQRSTAHVVESRTEAYYHVLTIDLGSTYGDSVERFHRTFVLVEQYGLIIVDSIVLAKPKTLNWRLHSPLESTLTGDAVTLNDPALRIEQYKCCLVSHPGIAATLQHGYEGELNIPDRSIESDASKNIVHMDWALPADTEHHVIGCCIRDGLALPKVHSAANGVIDGLKVQGQVISVSLV